ncbi:UNKNOWN [Stylonychia lemnae]|uniref:Uncharacterized protein n=1 Tax=Stylonychia lemnae TaxID=5949 RepID=A0A077ZU99_STYLE|nr:UNKNOWN [Stylonychia lemnae]|eukprot:CDW72865.1 UNKNOWN [Stylonychia lemnae]
MNQILCYGGGNTIIYRLIYQNGNGLNGIMIAYEWQASGQFYKAMSLKIEQLEWFCSKNLWRTMLILKTTIYQNLVLKQYKMGQVQQNPTLSSPISTSWIGQKLKFLMVSNQENISSMGQPFCTSISYDGKEALIYGSSEQGQTGFRVKYTLQDNSYSVMRLYFEATRSNPIKFKSYFSKEFGYDYYVYGYAYEFIDCLYENRDQYLSFIFLTSSQNICFSTNNKFTLVEKANLDKITLEIIAMNKFELIEFEDPFGPDSDSLLISPSIDPNQFDQNEKACKQIPQSQLNQSYYLTRGNQISLNSYLGTKIAQKIVFPTNQFQSNYDANFCPFQLSYYIDQLHKPSLDNTGIFDLNKTHKYFEITETMNETNIINNLTLNVYNYDKYMSSTTSFKIILQCDFSSIAWKQTQFGFECTQGESGFAVLYDQIYSLDNNECDLAKQLEMGFKSDIFILDSQNSQLKVLCSASDTNIGSHSAILNMNDENGSRLKQVFISISINKKKTENEIQISDCKLDDLNQNQMVSFEYNLPSCITDIMQQYKLRGIIDAGKASQFTSFDQTKIVFNPTYNDEGDYVIQLKYTDQNGKVKVLFSFTLHLTDDNTSTRVKQNLCLQNGKCTVKIRSINM